MAGFVVHFYLTNRESVYARVQAETQEEATAGVERARQSPTILLRGVGARQDIDRLIGSTQIANCTVLDQDPQTPVSYTLDLPE
jgi:hypothetical protein